MPLEMIFLSGFAGITVFFGGLLANYFNHHMDETPVKYELSHMMMSFGAGIILSAIALVLVPKALAELSLFPLSFSFMAGAIIFMLADKYLGSSGDKKATLLAMLMDFIPESIALGAIYVLEPKMAGLLAIFIGLQNLPEAFNSFRDLVQSGYSVRKTLTIFFFLSFFGIGSALIGHYFLRNTPELTALLMSFASGGILYLLIQDIIPESKMKNHYWISFGATLGFLVGMIGEKLV
jgi:ZIP family zinc transporter